MNTTRFTPEERVLHDKRAFLNQMSHYMTDFVNENDQMDWDSFKENCPEEYEAYLNLTSDEIEECLSELRKIGAALHGYLTVMNILREYQNQI